MHKGLGFVTSHWVYVVVGAYTQDSMGFNNPGSCLIPFAQNSCLQYGMLAWVCCTTCFDLAMIPGILHLFP